MKVIKQAFARRLKKQFRRVAAAQGRWEFEIDQIWQKRFYDLNVWRERKRIEKLRYMHRNPVKWGLVEQPDQWKWSSFRAYFYRETGPVRVNFQELKTEITIRPLEKFGSSRVQRIPLIRKERG